MVTQTPQATCPACGHQIKIGARFCSRCRQRLEPVEPSLVDESSVPLPDSPVESQSLASSPTSVQAAKNGAPPQLTQRDAKDTREDKVVTTSAASFTQQSISPPIEPSSAPELDEIARNLSELLSKAEQGNMEQSFPGEIPNKTQKMEVWKAQLRCASDCAALLRLPQFQRLDQQRDFQVRHHLAEAVHVLDFTREYRVKLVGSTGAGKSTVLAAMVGRDIFPRQAGGAMTAVPTHVRLCDEQAPEEMQVHFFTREEFEEVIKRTEARKETSVSDEERQALEAELALLRRVENTYGKQYLRDKEPLKEEIPVEQWGEKIPYYVEERAATEQEEIRPTRLVKYVEFAVPVKKTSRLLSPNSIIVDLPGGGAGLPRHDMILQEELSTADAVILVVDAHRGADTIETHHIFEEVKNKFVSEKGDKAAALMAFVVVSRWDEIKDQADREKIRRSMEKLLSKLPGRYDSYHMHGAQKAFFYQLRALDALLATLGSNGVTNVREEEGRTYTATVRSNYQTLKEIPQIGATLPNSFTAETFQEIQPAQHKAMLEYSGFAELARDLQAFLAKDRYDAQMMQSSRAIGNVLQQLRDVCLEALRKLGFRKVTSPDLEQERKEQESQHDSDLLRLLESNIYKMHTAWEAARAQFKSRADSAFHARLSEACVSAKHSVETRIRQGAFDSFFEADGGGRGDDPTSLEESWVDVRGQPLIRQLRESFLDAMEQEIEKLAHTLARAFLDPLEGKENEGLLDIRRVAHGESGAELDQIEQSYKRIKEEIESIAVSVCRYVAISEVLNKRNALQAHDGEVDKLYAHARKPSSPSDEFHQDIGAILDKIYADLPSQIDDRIIRLFQYELRELDKLQSGADMATPAYRGEFATRVVERLRALLLRYLSTPDSQLRRELEEQQGQPDIEPWISALKRIEALESHAYVGSA